MATAHKSSTAKPRRQPRRTPSRPRNVPNEDLKRLRQQVTKMAAAVQEIVDSGLLSLTQHLAANRPRKPLPEYAKVVAVGAADEVSEVRGRTGIVLDAAELEGGWTYTVYFPSRQEALVLHEASLWDTGETVPEDVIYGGGETRRVRVDSKGNSTLVS